MRTRRLGADPDERFKVVLASVLRKRRRAKGLSQRELGRMSGVGPAYISKVEAGRLIPGLLAAARVIMVLELNPTELWLLVALASGMDEITAGEAALAYRRAEAGNGSAGAQIADPTERGPGPV